MNELQVIYTQQPGVITWNFEELKAAVSQQMKTYETMVYTDDNIGAAKKDVATLRKLKKAVEDKRIEIKKKFMEPYDSVEVQAKQLVALIDKPITTIDKQVKAFEAEQKAKRKEAVMKYMRQAFSEFVPNIQKKAMFKFYDSRWENAGAKEKDWKAAVDAAAAQVKGDLAIINDTEKDLWEAAFTTYQQNLVLSEALAKVQEMRRQKEIILENERKRREAEELRRAQEQARREEQERQRQTQAALQQSREAEEQAQPAQETAQPETEMGKAIQSIERQALDRAAHSDPSTGRTVIIKASDAQYKKILAYISYVGAEYREV